MLLALTAESQRRRTYQGRQTDRQTKRKVGRQMFITIETQTERFFVEAVSCSLHPIVPSQEGEPKTVKTKTLQVNCVDGEVINYDLAPGEVAYVMNNSGKTINRFYI